jgi:pimeloyl-ACP methyl ester carboxylesterase
LPMLHSDLAVHQHGPEHGPDLLLVHGLTDSAGGWAQAVGHWTGAHRVTTVDLRGHGESPRFTAEQLAQHPGELMVEELHELVAQLDRPVVLGHSLGGAVALAVTVRAPELVRALVLEDPAPRSPGEPQALPARGEEYLEGMRGSREAVDEQELLRLRRATHPGWPEQELLPTGRAEQQVQADYLLGGDWKPRAAWPELLGRLRVPTLLLTGGKLDEVIVSPDLERQWLETAPHHLTVRRLEGAGHCVRRDRQDAFYAAVDHWLASLP